MLAGVPTAGQWGAGLKGLAPSVDGVAWEAMKTVHKMQSFVSLPLEDL
jgi:hypothetical protein